MSKKWLALLLSLVMILSLAACGKTDEPASMEVATQEAQQTTEAVSFDMTALVADYFANMPEHIYKIDQTEFIEKVKSVRRNDDYRY